MSPGPITTRSALRWIGGQLAFPLGAWLTGRVVVQAVGWIVVALNGVPEHARPGPFGTFYNWDSGYFGCILESGYFGPACADGATSERFAFFPGYPLLARGIGWLIGLGDATSVGTFVLWLIPAGCSLVATLVLYRIAEHTYGERIARRAVVLFVGGPYAVFLAASYSESLYLAGALAAWWCCLRRHYLLAAGFGMIATATRVSGLFLVPALLVLYLVDTRQHPGTFRWRRLLTLAGSGLGAAAYLGWLWWRTGDPSAWFAAQRDGWHRQTRWPWETLWRQGIHILAEPAPDWRIQSILELIFAAGLGLAVVAFLLRREWPAAILAGLTAGSLMTSNSYLSLARNTVTVFPLFLLLAVLTVRWPRVFRFRPILAVGVVLMLYHSVQFALGHWAG